MVCSPNSMFETHKEGLTFQTCKHKVIAFILISKLGIQENMPGHQQSLTFTFYFSISHN